MAAQRWSYTSGTSDVPLIGLTIGDMFDGIADRYPDNEAVVSRHQNLRYTYRQLKAGGRPLRPRPDGPRGRQGRANRHLVAELRGVGDHAVRHCKVGAILVNINPSYRVHELQYALRQSGCTWLIIAPPFKTSDYTGMLHEVAPELARCRLGRLPPRSSPTCARWSPRRAASRDAPLGRRPGPRRRVGADELAGASASRSSTTRSTSSTRAARPAIPKGATLTHHTILNNGYFVGEQLRFTERDRLLHPGAALPLLRHGHGQPRAASTHGATMVYPSDGFDPTAGSRRRQAERATALLRRADDVHRRAPPRFRAVRPVRACAPASWPARRARSR